MTAVRPRFVLGSGSPRRLELLAQLGLAPDEIISPEIDETPRKGELPRPYCIRMAREKLAAIDAAGVVLSADTTVALGRRILGKPQDRDEAEAFLMLLSGRRHRVISAVAVRSHGGVLEKTNVTSVRMKRLSEREISGYLDTGDWKGKAGGYAIQGPAAAFIPWIAGSYSGVMGLPLSEAAGLLKTAGILA